MQQRRSTASPASWAGRLRRQAPYIGLWLVIAVGMALIWTEYWRRGLVVMAAATFGAGLVRIFVSSRFSGWLVVRGKWADATFCFAAAIGLAVLAFLVRS